MHVLTLRQARVDLKQILDDVCWTSEPVVITRKSGDHVVMISLDDYKGMLETMYLLGSPENSSHLCSSIAQFRSGKP